MEKEVFLTGYCRQIDQSRMVEAVIDGNCLTEVDCCYETCIYTPNCTIAQQLSQALKQ